MSEFLRWWLVLMLMGAVALPLCLAMFRPLADRGYALSKPFALLTIGFTFWLLNTFRLIPNSRLGIILVMVLIAAISAAIVYRERDELQAWLRARWRYILAVEAAFLLVFAIAVMLRASVGQINMTEQPMDLMFLNATTRAENFPPKDPWLSGYTVAYYYFGYLIVGMVGIVAGVPTSIGYNIGLGMIAALSLSAGFGLAYNLIRIRDDVVEAEESRRAPAAREKSAPAPKRERQAEAAVAAGERGAIAMSASDGLRWRPAVFGVAGALLLVVAGNFVWVLVFASSYGFGSEGFYEWLQIQDLTADEPRGTWYPSQFFGFFNASRIYPINDNGFWAITEFPMFSFILGDLHPHVMALPFVALVAAMALAFFRSREPLDVVFWLQRPLLLPGAAILLGGLAFLNTWDIATMSFVVVAAVAVSNYGRIRALGPELVLQTVTFSVPLLALAVILYIPFFATFSSQANGIGAVVTRPGVEYAGTRPIHAFIYWGPLLIIVLPFVAKRLWALRDRITLVPVAVSAAVPTAVVVGWALFYAFQRWRNDDKLGGAGGFVEQLTDRGTGWLTAIAIGIGLAAILVRLWLEMTSSDDREERQGPIAVLLLAATATLLALGTEFFYVGDLFNSRMNTVFKLYYQAWMLMAIAAGFALYYLAAPWREGTGGSALRYAWGGAVVLALAGSALYPLGATFNRTRPYNNGEAIKMDGKLDGIAFRSADELEAIDFLNGIAQGQKYVIVEGLGNDYDAAAARISGATGLPTVLGWRGHEDQWRGGEEPRRGRVEDIELLYSTTDMAQATAIIEKYDISFIYVGEFERKYPGSGLAKFESLPVLFESKSGAVKIYTAQ